MLDFKQRSEEFNREINILEKKWGLHLYAAQVVLRNGEIITAVRLSDTEPLKEQVKKYEDLSKKGNSANKKA